MRSRETSLRVGTEERKREKKGYSRNLIIISSSYSYMPIHFNIHTYFTTQKLDFSLCAICFVCSFSTVAILGYIYAADKSTKIIL